MNAEQELKDFEIIDKDGNLIEWIWRNSNWQELHIELPDNCSKITKGNKTKGIEIRCVELDDAQRNFYVDIENAPVWAEDIVEYIQENYGKISL